MTEHEIRGVVKEHVDHLFSEGMSSAGTDEAIEKSIIDNWLQHGDAIPESTQLLFLMLLVTFEHRRRESKTPGFTH